MRYLFSFASLFLLGIPYAGTQSISPSGLLEQAQRSSSLTVEGKPFHAILEIGKPGTIYSGQVEVWWVSSDTYRSKISSPQFNRTLTANAGHTEESRTGDFLPRWLEDFELALLNPTRTGPKFTKGSLSASQSMTSSGKKHICIARDDRPGGITDQLTWGHICFEPDGHNMLLASVLTFNSSMEYDDWKNFGDKRIARSYTTNVLDYQPVKATITKLEPLPSLPADFFQVNESVTSSSKSLHTEFVSTQAGENLQEQTPNIEWPAVREGKTEGFMIVYARTDLTGQVREAAKHNSDQPGLETFGMQQALRYKFKPLLVNGVPTQIEMPLVLHFKTTLADPLPILSVADMKKQMMGCQVDPPRDLPFGSSITVRVSVNEKGEMTGAGPVTAVKGTGWLSSMESLGKCKYKPYAVNGRVTYYKGDILLVAP